tara:strand:- start:11429 stop:12556 length:1128 start_codon:yes stop_codon:yes gene_type:complete
MISKIKRIFKIFFKTKIKFKKLEKKEILFFDISHVDTIVNQFKLKNYHILHTRDEEYNFWILMSMIIKLKFNKVNYYRAYISEISPKVVITLIDNRVEFYELKKFFNKIIFISIQNGLRKPGYNDIFKQNHFLNSKNLSCDYIFTFNKFIATEYRKYIKSKYIAHGSFKNNIVNFNYKKKNKIFLLISQFRNLNSKQNIIYEKRVLSLLRKYFSETKSKLHILLSSKNNKNKLREKFFYKTYFGYNCNFCEGKKWQDSYKILDSYENIIFFDSTLGYEAISRKKKVAAISLRPSKTLKEYFGWPSNVTKRNIDFFVAKKLDYSEIKRILNNIKNCSIEKWNHKYFYLIKDQMCFDRNNMLLKKKIFEILDKNKNL